MDIIGSGHTRSSWIPPAGLAITGPLTKDLSVDVCVIGAGIAGLSTGYMLARQGQRVVVLDDGPIADGETSRTTAHLTNAVDDRFYLIERMHGPEAARLAGESHFAAIERIETIALEESIDCEFERLDGYLFLTPEQPKDIIDHEFDAARRAGIDVQRVERAPLNGFDTGPCLRFLDQAQFHPLKYLAGLTRGIEAAGGHIFTRSRASKVEGGSDANVQTASGPVVRAGAIVIATNTPVNDLVAIPTKQAPYRTYAIAARVPRGSVSKALFWDDGDPYHYIRLQRTEVGLDYELLIVGGEDHKTGQAHDFSERHARLEAWARQRFPTMGRVEFRWSGQVMEPVDSLAFIGRNPLDHDNVYIATGDSGQGITHGTIAGMILSDLIQGRDHPWAALYDPSRKTLGAIGDFARENLNVAAQYADWITPGEVDAVDKIALDQAAVLRSGLHKIAVYRDRTGQLHQLAAACSHLGCIVSWNELEKTWDCPCHGSRFDIDGKVLSGPALHGLRHVPPPEGSGGA